MQSLFVVFFTNPKNVDHFSLATKTHDMSYHTWLLIFTEFLNNDTRCHEPPGNLFNLVFNTRMIVACHGDRTVRKWYSLFRDKTEILNLTKWTRGTGLGYVDDNYHESRFDLAGMEIRVATVNYIFFFVINKVHLFIPLSIL